MTAEVTEPREPKHTTPVASITMQARLPDACSKRATERKLFDHACVNSLATALAMKSSVRPTGSLQISSRYGLSPFGSLFQKQFTSHRADQAKLPRNQKVQSFATLTRGRQKTHHPTKQQRYRVDRMVHADARWNPSEQKPDRSGRFGTGQRG